MTDIPFWEILGFTGHAEIIEIYLRKAIPLSNGAGWNEIFPFGNMLKLDKINLTKQKIITSYRDRVKADPLIKLWKK